MNDVRGRGAILVLGMDRSGTSLLAELTHRWGAFGGPVADLTDADAGNPHGYFEHAAAGALLREIRQAAGQFWHPAFRARVEELAERPDLRDRAQKLVDQMQRRAEVWFWKEPLFAVTLPFWRQILPDPVYLIPVRHPYESALSWQKYSLPAELQGKVSIVQATLLRWYATMRPALADTEGSRRRLFLSYDALIQEPEAQCRRLCRFLDGQFGMAGGGEGSEERVMRMTASIDPTLHRNRCATPFVEMPQPTEEEKELYRVLLRKTEDPDSPFDPARFPLPPIFQEYLDNVTTFAEFYRRIRPGGGQWAPRASR